MSERSQPPADDQNSEQDSGQEHESDNKEEHQSTKWPLIILAVLVVLAIIGGLIYWFMTKDEVSTDDAFVDGRAVLVAPQVSGTVIALKINDNQFVHQGDLLFQIDPRQFQAARDQSAGQLAAVEAQLDSARASLDKSRTTSPAQLTQARGQLAQAQAQLVQAGADYRRQHNLDRAATSQQNIDKATADFKQAQAQVLQAQAQVEQAKVVPQDIAQSQAQVAQLEGQVEQAKAGLAQAELNLGYTQITAPQDGWITRRNVEAGNFVTTGAPVLSIVSPQVWVTANFKENQLRRMRPGDMVDVAVDAYPSLKLSGHVDSIQLGSGSRFSAFPAENATGNFVKIVQRIPVKIVIDNGLDPNLPLPLGASVEPTVRLK